MDDAFDSDRDTDDGHGTNRRVPAVRARDLQYRMVYNGKRRDVLCAWGSLMTLSLDQQVRLRLTDPVRIEDRVYFGDGSASSFVLPHNNIVSGTGYVMAGGGWSATGASFNPSGEVVFSGVPIDQQQWRVRYQWSVFSDEEIGYFTAEGGDAVGAAILGVQTLIVDASKRSQWMSPDGSQFSDIGSINALYAAYSALKDEQLNAGAATVSFQSWTINQQDW
jgi:hypothetical protein